MMKEASGCWLWQEGRFVPCDGVPTGDRGWRYGMAFFESLAVRGGRVEFWQAHRERLISAAREHGWELDMEGLDAVEGWLRKVFGQEAVFARVYLTAGDGPPGGKVDAPRLFCFGEPRSTAPVTTPYRLVISQRAYLPLPGGWKRACYWANLAAWEEAKGGGADEAVLLSPSGELVSAAMANLFLVQGGQMVTPRLASGARRGVIRQWVMAYREQQGEPVEERELHVDDLKRADEVFLTSSWHGVIPVAGLQPWGSSVELPFPASGEARRLRVALRDFLFRNPI